METFNQVRAIVAGATGLETDEIKPTSTVEDLKLDSLSVIDIAVRIEEQCGRRIEDEDICTIRTIQDMVDLAQSSHEQ